MLHVVKLIERHFSHQPQRAAPWLVPALLAAVAAALVTGLALVVR